MELTANKHTKYCSPVIPPQGPGGLASGGRESLVLNAMMLSRQGLMQSLPLYPSTKGHLNIGIITGLTETTNPDGSLPVVEPQGCCDDYPQAGLLTMCEWCSPWGVFGRQSRIYSLCEDDSYCDMPMEVVGGVLDQRRNAMAQAGGRGNSRYAAQPGMMNNGLGGHPSQMIINEGNILNSSYDKAMFELAATFQRDMAPQYFNGNPAGVTGVHRPFKGLASIINTGYVDAISGQPCPAADSIVMSAKDHLGVDKACQNASGFVNLVSQLVSNSKQLSFDMGLGIIDGVFIGPSWMRDCIIRMWACGYGGCTCCGEEMGGMGGQQITTISTEATQMRDDMMSGSYIVVDGMAVPWIVDDSDTYSSYDRATGERTGRLFFTPITVMNGTIPVFYQQFRPWNTAEITKALQNWAPQGYFMPEESPNGAWLLFKKPPQNLCLQIAGTTKRRLAHHAPFLAFQLTDITCCTFTPPRNFGQGRTEGLSPEPCIGVPSAGGDLIVNGTGATVTVMDMTKPHCLTIKVDGVATPTTLYLQPNGCYLDKSGREINVGDACPEAGACVLPFESTQWCFNPWSGASMEVWLQEDGTYNTETDGSGEVVDTGAGTMCEGACPVVYVPTAYCVNPHVGDPIQAYLMEDDTYNTEMDGSGSIVGTSGCDVVEGECPVLVADDGADDADDGAADDGAADGGGDDGGDDDRGGGDDGGMSPTPSPTVHPPVRSVRSTKPKAAGSVRSTKPKAAGSSRSTKPKAAGKK